MRKLLLWLLGVHVIALREGDILLVEMRNPPEHGSIDDIANMLHSTLGFEVPVVYAKLGEGRMNIIRGTRA